MERLSDTAIEIINDLHTERLEYITEYIPLIDSANKLAEYEDLEEQGLLLRFLCKVGDTVFFRNKRGETILPVTIENIHLGEGKCCIEYFGWFFNGYGEPTMGFTFTENDFGKTVFLTKEEAEAKLKELEGSEEE